MPELGVARRQRCALAGRVACRSDLQVVADRLSSHSAAGATTEVEHWMSWLEPVWVRKLGLFEPLFESV
eukprot:13825915-Alexandrium_andersonii.AAC.1